MALMMSTPAKADCPHLYPEQKTIYVKNTVELCNSWYVSRYNEKERKVIFVSEILDAKTSVTERSDNFVSDERVKNPVKNFEYFRTGFDRGHLAPAGDASNQKEMIESFFLTNAVPQSPKLNRGEWRKLEKRIREKAKDPVYVITGALYEITMPGMITVPVPNALYKIVYFKSGTEYWYAENRDEAQAVRVSRGDLERRVGYTFP
jgi:endonuclease G, mitochondrial